METGSETEEEDKLPVSEEDPLINGTGSPASLTNPEASPRAESHGLLTKEEEDDEMRDSGVEHIWPDNDMLSASVDGTGECLQSLVELNLNGRSWSTTDFKTTKLAIWQTSFFFSSFHHICLFHWASVKVLA